MTKSNYLLKYICVFALSLLFAVISHVLVYADNSYYCYMTEDNEPYGTSIGYPYWGGFYRYYDNTTLQPTWVYSFVPNNDNPSRYMFPFYFTEDRNELNFNCSVQGNHSRRTYPYSISDVMNMVSSYNYDTTISDNDIFTVSVGDKIYYCYVPSNIINNVDSGKMGKYTLFDTNINFKLYKNEKALPFMDSYKDIVKDLLNGKNYNGEVGGEFILDENGNPTDKPNIYDLEVPLNVTCKYYDKKFDNSYYQITWQQSDNVNIQGWVTEISVAQKVKYGKYQWSVWTSPHTYESKYHKIDEVQTYIGNYKKIWSDSDLNEDIKGELYNYVENEKGYHPMSTSVQLTNFCIRNKFIDSNGYTHYSDYVYLKEDDEGNYTASVISSQGVDDNGGIGNIQYGNEDSIVDTNNDTYINTDVSSNTTSFTGGVSTIKSLFEDLKQFPKLLAEMFSFIPGQFIYALTALLIVLIPIAIIKLVL